MTYKNTYKILFSDKDKDGDISNDMTVSADSKQHAVFIFGVILGQANVNVTNTKIQMVVKV